MRLILAAAAVVALSCSESLAPGRPLLGSWSDRQTAFAAGLAGATLQRPCITATFAPIRLDDSLRFQATGTVTHAVGLATFHEEDPFPISGQLIGARLALGADTLVPGDTYQPVCNAYVATPRSPGAIRLQACSFTRMPPPCRSESASLSPSGHPSVAFEWPP
jgi:hypothetical protein